MAETFLLTYMKQELQLSFLEGTRKDYRLTTKDRRYQQQQFQREIAFELRLPTLSSHFTPGCLHPFPLHETSLFLVLPKVEGKYSSPLSFHPARSKSMCPTPSLTVKQTLFFVFSVLISGKGVCKCAISSRKPNFSFL